MRIIPIICQFRQLIASTSVETCGSVALFTPDNNLFAFDGGCQGADCFYLVTLYCHHDISSRSNSMKPSTTACVINEQKFYH